MSGTSIIAQIFVPLSNTPFGQLIYCSVIRLSHFPKDHISRKICIKLVNFNMVGGYFPNQKFY